MRDAKFIIDIFPGQQFEGFSNGESWNGWACPYFTFEEGVRIMKAHNSDGARAYFRDENDRFVFEIEDEEEVYPAVKENDKKLYPIGSGSWIWEESE